MRAILLTILIIGVYGLPIYGAEDAGNEVPAKGGIHGEGFLVTIESGGTIVIDSGRRFTKSEEFIQFVRDGAKNHKFPKIVVEVPTKHSDKSEELAIFALRVALQLESKGLRYYLHLEEADLTRNDR